MSLKSFDNKLPFLRGSDYTYGFCRTFPPCAPFGHYCLDTVDIFCRRIISVDPDKCWLQLLYLTSLQSSGTPCSSSWGLVAFVAERKIVRRFKVKPARRTTEDSMRPMDVFMLRPSGHICEIEFEECL
ncbi:hypothetical protein C8R44DRAFT_326835 [Mycena epipterygia]|nr:hypothetical protein C8R44DRAFT_326835 [Mycena epipterygia]